MDGHTESLSAGDKQDTIVDVAIVGAGVGGLYCAWRLAKDRSDSSIYMFEKDGRVGGRLLSVNLLPDGGRKAELGGMRFTARQLLISQLVEYLELEHPKERPFVRDFTFETRLMYLRGCRLRAGDRNWSNKPYQLPDIGHAALKDGAMTIAKVAIRNAFGLMEIKNPKLGAAVRKLKTNPSKSALTIAQWDAIQTEAKINDLHLYNLGFWNLLQHCLNDAPDEFLFLHDALGYESLIANSNAAQGIPVFLGDFDVKEYSTLAGGMESLPKMLAFDFREAGRDCLIAEHHTVESITLVPEDSGTKHHFELRVKSTPAHSGRDLFSYKGTYRARQVILALPKVALINIDLHGFNRVQAGQFRSNLDRVTAHPAFKLFLQYDEPWWTSDLGALRGRATTDLPIRQVYYLGEHERKPALVMASYSDEHYVDFWDPLVKDPERDREIMRQTALGMQQSSAYAASRRIIEKAESQLQIMHGLKHPPRSKFGIVKEWSEAWHFWNVHIKPWDAAAEMIRPFPGISLFTCGEAYSLEQGWVEGALKSAERVLREMKVAEPSWVRRDRYATVGCRSFSEYISH